MLSASHINEDLDQSGIDNQIKFCISILQELSQSWTPARRFCGTIMRIAEGKSTGALKIGSIPNTNVSVSHQVGQTSTDALDESQDISSNMHASLIEPESCSLSGYVSLGASLQDDLYTSNPPSINFETELSLPWENIPLDLQSWYHSWEEFSADWQLS
jgi:hypothetical protein